MSSEARAGHSTRPDDARGSASSVARALRDVAAWFADSYAKPLWWRLAAGAAMALVGAAIRFALVDALENRVAYVTFYPAVELAALVGGLAAGGFATLICALLTHFWFIPLAHPGDWVGLALFLATAASIAGITDLMRHALIRATRAEALAAEDDRLRIVNERLRLAASAGAIGAWDVDVLRKSAEMNPEMCDIYGVPPDARADSDAILALVSPESAPAAKDAMLAALDPSGDGRYRAEYRIRRASDGTERWINARAQAFFANGCATRLVGICRDVTDEKKVEELLAEKARMAEQFASLAAALPGVICSLRQSADGKRRFSYVSKNFSDVYGLSPEEAAADAQCVLERVHLDDLEQVRAGVAESARTLTLWRDEFRYDHPEKGTIWLEGQSTPVLEANGDIVWHGYVKDVTQRKRAEHELRASEARSRTLFESGLIGVVSWKADGAITDANDKFLDMLGYDRSDLEAGRIDWRKSTPPEYRALDEAGMRDLERMGVNERPFEKEFFRKDGTRAPVLIAGVMLDEARTRGVAFVLDISERKAAEAQMQRLHADRMNVMQSMAAGLAHEINQPLTATVAYLKAARRLMEIEEDRKPASVAETLDKAAAQVSRAGQIVTRLREFIAHGEPDKTPVRLHELIAEAFDSANAASRAAHIRSQLRLLAENDFVLADRVQIEQVLVNLIRNAQDAMNASQKRELVVSTSSDKSEICVAITDTGVGLSECVRSTLFQPFATSKASGMGVGLSISRAIIEAHHGRIWAESNPDGGAVFKFALPLADASVRIE